jgi:predicted transcriptional regulator
MTMNALQQALADVPVHAAMSQPMKCARADWTVRQLIAFFMEERIYGAPVLGRNGEPVGVATARDVIGFESLDRDELRALLHLKAMEGDAQDQLAWPENRLAPEAGRPDDNCTVAEIMTRTLISVPRTASLLEVVRLMHQHHIHRVFVVDDGELVGVVSSSTLVRALVGTYVAG